MTSLNARLLDAHAKGAHFELIALYSEAAEAAGDIDARCFFLTHAYVFALELNHPDISKIHMQLEGHQRI